MPSLVRVRTLPWLALLDVARTTKAHLDEHLTAKDRKRIAAIASKTKGDVRKLSERDKADLKAIARELNLALLARNLVPTAGRLRRGRRR
ncbi:MAG: hypothetical protein QOG68_484 [Solirubrobacteraceae bacterium]|jgi:hypothetical protein|nr:hypothetical protein [Solirubrobacteraceae bacterium]